MPPSAAPGSPRRSRRWKARASVVPVTHDGLTVYPCPIKHAGRCVYGHTYGGWVCTTALRLMRPPIPCDQYHGERRNRLIQVGRMYWERRRAAKEAT